VPVGYRGQELLFEPLRPQELLLLLAGRAEGAAAAGERDEDARPTGAAPKPCEAVGADILRLLGRSALHLVKKVGLTPATR
jgi:hypothetical protein